jgi:hypothetical protein
MAARYSLIGFQRRAAKYAAREAERRPPVVGLQAPAGLDHLRAEEEIVMPNYVPLVSGFSKTFNPQGLNIRGASKAAGTQAIERQYSNFGTVPYADNELFELRITGEKVNGANYVFIIAKHSQMALTVPSANRALK